MLESCGWNTVWGLLSWFWNLPRHHLKWHISHGRKYKTGKNKRECNGVFHTLYHPPSNGMAERVNNLIKRNHTPHDRSPTHCFATKHDYQKLHSQLPLEHKAAAHLDQPWQGTLSRFLPAIRLDWDRRDVKTRKAFLLSTQHVHQQWKKHLWKKQWHRAAPKHPKRHHHQNTSTLRCS